MGGIILPLALLSLTASAELKGFEEQRIDLFRPLLPDCFCSVLYFICTPRGRASISFLKHAYLQQTWSPRTVNCQTQF